MTVTVVIPVKNERPTLTQGLLQQGPELHGHSLRYLVVDDGSSVPYPTAAIRHSTSLGYGRSLKDGISATNTEWVATMDGDGQHELVDLVRLLDTAERFPEVEMIVGDRRIQEQQLSRYLGRKALNWAASLFAWRFIPDLNSGLRVFKVKTARGYFPILSDGFSFTTSLTLSMLADGYRVEFVPIKVQQRDQGLSHVQPLKDGWHTLMRILYIGCGLRTRRLRAWWRSIFV